MTTYSRGLVIGLALAALGGVACGGSADDPETATTTGAQTAKPQSHGWKGLYGIEGGLTGDTIAVNVTAERPLVFTIDGTSLYWDVDFRDLKATSEDGSSTVSLDEPDCFVSMTKTPQGIDVEFDLTNCTKNGTTSWNIETPVSADRPPKFKGSLIPMTNSCWDAKEKAFKAKLSCSSQ